MVTTPAGEVSTSGRMVWGVSVQIQQDLFIADLFLFDMTEFDIIFGMDWMSRHRGMIDTYKKKIYFRLRGRRRCSFQGTSRDRGSLLVGYQHIQRYIDSGAEVFMAVLVSSEPSTRAISDISIVREFPDVFPDELPSLLPKREVEFGIELVSGTEPISILS